MDLSLLYFADDAADHAADHAAGDTTGAGADRYRALLDGARFADRHGFRAVWTPERHFAPFGGSYPNPAVVGAAVAAITERVGVRAGSVVAPLHHAARIAEDWSVVDNLSGGRAGVALAPGWHATDFALRPDAYPGRRALVAEQVEAVRRYWRGEGAELVDGAGQTVTLRTYPPPVQAELPLWLSSSGSAATFRTAARLGVGVLTTLIGHDAVRLAERVAEYRALHRELHGGPGHVVLMLHTFLGRDTGEVREIVREPFTAYLRASAAQVLGGAADLLADAELDEEEIDFMVARAFDGYFRDAGLLGTVDDALRVLARLAPIGLDEIACLVDFVPRPEAVLDGLRHLDEVRARIAGDTR